MTLPLRSNLAKLGRRRYSRACLSSHVNISRQNTTSNPIPSRRPHLCACLSTAGGKATPETKIEKIIRDSIAATGPISMSRYMQLCLSHPTDGYYMNPTHSVFGPQGDFITSPEISQVFGELLAIWHLAQVQQQPLAKELRIVELGPGRGTLMNDTLRVFQQFPQYWEKVRSVHLVETSLNMRELQKKALRNHIQKMPDGFHWHDSLDDIIHESKSEGVYTILNAHEFFDALPVHLIEKHNDAWYDVLISTAPDPTKPTIIRPSTHSPTLPMTDRQTSPSVFRFVRSPEPSTAAQLLANSSPRFAHLVSGTRMEISPAAFKIARQVGDLLSGKSGAGGSALVVDYGDVHAFGNSIRAFKEHKVVDIFHQPGLCDLTANVDFAYLKEAMAGVVTTLGPLTQHDFLRRMGIDLRIQKLKENSRDQQRGSAIETAAKRLIDMTGMGKQYKVLGVLGRPDGAQREGAEMWPFVTQAAASKTTLA